MAIIFSAGAHISPPRSAEGQTGSGYPGQASHLGPASGGLQGYS